MEKKICINCEQAIELNEASFLYQNHVVCKTCKTLLDEESEFIEVVNIRKSPKNLIDNIRFGRSVYLFSMLSISIAIVYIRGIIPMNSYMTYLSEIIWLIFAFTFTVGRMRNIGMNPWWSLLLLVPFVNFIQFVICLIRQNGDIKPQKLDKVGKILLIMVLIISLFVIALTLINERQYFFGMR